MFKSLCKVVKTIDNTKNLILGLEELKHLDVLVGIPESKSARKSDELNNAELGFLLSEGVSSLDMQKEVKTSQKAGANYQAAREAYIQTHGNPAFHIPPRPFLEPSIEANKDVLAKQHAKIVLAALNGNINQARIEVRKLGMLGQNIVRAWFTDPRNNWAPNAKSTIKAKGSSRPNIDEGQLRRSVTYSIRDKNSYD